MQGPKLGEHFSAPIPENSHEGITVAVLNRSSHALTATQLRHTVWALRYQALFHYNRSPWVERDYSAPIVEVLLVSPKAVPGIPTAPEVPADAWVIELLDTSDQPGAIGYHEDRSRVSKAGASGVHSTSGVALHPKTGQEIPLAKVFCKTAKEDGAPITEVASHEMLEMAVDPWVMDEATIRAYRNPADGKEYIAEVGDPVQERAYDVGEPEGRPCGVREALVADFAYPAWWEQPQRRPGVCFGDDSEAWLHLHDVPHLGPFMLAPGGYMSRRKPGGEWEQEYGSDHPAAQHNADAYERPGEVG